MRFRQKPEKRVIKIAIISVMGIGTVICLPGRLVFFLRDTVSPPELHFAEISFKVFWAHIIKNAKLGSFEYG